MAGEITYFEIPTRDADAARRFYGQLLGWRFEDANVPDYAMIAGAGTQAGLAVGDDSRAPRVFFAVDDLAAACDRIRDLGGTADETVSIPSGTFARCLDDQGTPFTLWEDAR